MIIQRIHRKPLFEVNIVCREGLVPTFPNGSYLETQTHVLCFTIKNHEQILLNQHYKKVIRAMSIKSELFKIKGFVK